MKPLQEKYKDEDELSDEFCSRSKCSACDGTDYSGEPNGYGCTDNDNFISDNMHRLTTENVICEYTYKCEGDCEHKEIHSCENYEIERDDCFFEDKVCKCIDFEKYEKEIKPSRYKMISKTKKNND